MELIEYKLDTSIILRKLWRMAIAWGYAPFDYTYNDFCLDMRMNEYKDKCRYCGK